MACYVSTGNYVLVCVLCTLNLAVFADPHIPVIYWWMHTTVLYASVIEYFFVQELGCLRPLNLIRNMIDTALIFLLTFLQCRRQVNNKMWPTRDGVRWQIPLKLKASNL